jgi:hypothetical protein
MKKLYAVLGKPSVYGVVKAESKEEAFDVFAKSQLEDGNFTEEITEFITNFSLLGEFFKDDEGSFHNDCTGEYPERLEIMSDEEQEQYVKGWIEKNVRAFWHDQPQFAEEYIRELNKSYESDDFYTGQFSEEFMIDTIKRIINAGNWYDDFEIVEIDLEENDYQIIYEDK